MLAISKGLPQCWFVHFVCIDALTHISRAGRGFAGRHDVDGLAIGSFVRSARRQRVFRVTRLLPATPSQPSAWSTQWRYWVHKHSYLQPCSLFCSFGEYHNNNFCPKIIHSTSAAFSFNGVHETPSPAYPRAKIQTAVNTHTEGRFEQPIQILQGIWTPNLCVSSDHCSTVQGWFGVALLRFKLTPWHTLFLIRL